MENLGKIQPQAVDIENSLIGQILLDSFSLINVSNIINEEMFYNENNKIVYQNLLAMSKNNEKIDTLTFINKLRSKGLLEQVGGISVIMNYTRSVLSSVNIRDYAKIILEKYLHRKLIENNHNQAIRLWSGLDFEFNFEIENVKTEIENISKIFIGINNKRQTWSDLLIKTQEKYFEKKTKKVKEYEFAIADLNKYLMFERGDLILIAARPGMGKTAFALQLVRDYSKGDKKGLIISLEMTQEKLTARIIIGEARVDSNRYRNGLLHAEEEKSVDKTINEIEKWNLDIEDKAGLTINQIETLIVMGGFDYAVIDYLGLISLPQKDTRNNELGSISRKLKEIAKRCNIPILALHQLNRDVEKRGNKRPILSDLRDSGELEQDADIILFLYRDAYYQKNNGNTIEIDIAKYREGATGIIELYHDYQISNFCGQSDSMEIYNLQENINF